MSLFRHTTPEYLVPLSSYRHADDESGLTWGGVTYETASGRPRGYAKTERVVIEEGFEIQATEIVLVSFKR
ncbi:hypothetical protein NMY22_g19626 [Coprinellus aureogranulatus]|nr:hypothetical protein NMY22_g19626 [Coprinellus aureogranulatus]